jgi:hypothetical protein
MTTYLGHGPVGFAPVKKCEPWRGARFVSGCEIGTPYPHPRHPYPGHRGFGQTRALPYRCEQELFNYLHRGNRLLPEDF